MAKPEWGAKHTCQSCGTRFYDLRRGPPVVCPKCGAHHEPDGEPRAKDNTTTTAAAEPPMPPPADELKRSVSEPKEGGEKVEEKDEAGATKEEGKEGEDFIEDANELGEDDEVLADVTDGNRDEEEATK